MDGVRWWIVDEIARWWATASEEQRGLLMLRARDGTKEATLAEVQQGALAAELDQIAERQRETVAKVVARWKTGQGVGRG